MHTLIFALITYLLCLITPLNSFAETIKRTSKLDAFLPSTHGHLDRSVLNTAFDIYFCAKKMGLRRTRYLILVDFSKPSNEKRLWLFDMKKNQLVTNTWVAHGTNSGELYAKYFSNQPQSYKSSLGLYQTSGTYMGKSGYSLRLNGLSKGYNDNALKRSIVMHGSWYVSENFIKKYGRAGRSWGCPAVPWPFARHIIDIIKGGSFLLIYSPDKGWQKDSRFLKCGEKK